MLVKDEEVLDGEGKGFYDLPCALTLVRRHELAEFSQMQEVAPTLSELATELLEGLRHAANVADDQIRVRVEGERGLFKLEHLLRWDTL